MGALKVKREMIESTKKLAQKNGAARDRRLRERRKILGFVEDPVVKVHVTARAKTDGSVCVVNRKVVREKAESDNNVRTKKMCCRVRDDFVRAR